MNDSVQPRDFSYGLLPCSSSSLTPRRPVNYFVLIGQLSSRPQDFNRVFFCLWAPIYPLPDKFLVILFHNQEKQTQPSPREQIYFALKTTILHTLQCTDVRTSLESLLVDRAYRFFVLDMCWSYLLRSSTTIATNKMGSILFHPTTTLVKPRLRKLEHMSATGIMQ